VAELIERYLDGIATRDWAVVRECVTDDIVRVGPYGDRYDGRDTYLAFISDLMPRLAGYAMEVHRVVYVGADSAFAELTETVDADGTPTRTREVLVFTLEGERIARVDIYIQTSPN
jgi:ketosteroid isomerase-like protein